MSIREDLRKARQIKPISGYDVLHEQRYAADTKHMIIFDVITKGSDDNSGERVRAFVSDDGYERAERIEERGDISIIRRYKVRKGNITYIPHRSKKANVQMQLEM